MITHLSMEPSRYMLSQVRYHCSLNEKLQFSVSNRSLSPCSRSSLLRTVMARFLTDLGVDSILLLIPEIGSNLSVEFSERVGGKQRITRFYKSCLGVQLYCRNRKSCCPHNMQLMLQVLQLLRPANSATVTDLVLYLSQNRSLVTQVRRQYKQLSATCMQIFGGAVVTARSTNVNVLGGLSLTISRLNDFDTATQWGEMVSYHNYSLRSA